MPDPRKGEQLLLLTTHPAAEAKALLGFARERGIAELMVPRAIRKVEAIPLLGTGKIDYPGVQRLAEGSSAGRDAA
jgi:acyl-[acyl-carrier-protein]-phospholipid O-acyltransferase/long-chain-fatty-acid--[acyl-carrier-protein] ligase